MYATNGGIISYVRGVRSMAASNVGLSSLRSTRRYFAGAGIFRSPNILGRTHWPEGA
jgi:hypothetical protein